MAGNVDRKKLWGRSGSRCAICNIELTRMDGLDVIVGDEAHIRSASVEGPRYDATYPTQHLDRYENLILLCKPHHKLVDDNSAVFTTEILEGLKQAHEHCVRRALGQDSKWVEEPVVRELSTGTELADLVMGASVYFMGNEHPMDDEEAMLIGCLLQEAQEWGDIASDVGIAGRVNAAMSLQAQMDELAARDLRVVGGRGRYRLLPDMIAPAACVRIERRVEVDDRRDASAGAVNDGAR